MSKTVSCMILNAEEVGRAGGRDGGREGGKEREGGREGTVDVLRPNALS